MHVKRDATFKVVWAAVLIVSLINLIVLLGYLTLPYSIDYSEGIIYLQKFSSLYAGFSTYPYLLTYYPPLYYIVYGLFRHAVSVPFPYFYDRALDFLALGACSILVYAISREVMNARKSYAALAAMAFLSVPLLDPSLSNPLFFELLFDLLAVFFIGRSKPNVYLSSLAVSVAFFFKQSGIVFFAAIALYLLVTGKRRELLLFAGIFALVSIPTIVLLNALTSGRFVLEVYLLPLMTPVFLANALQNWTDFFMLTPTMALLFAAALGYASKQRPLMLILLAVSALSTAASGKSGATSIYLMPFFAVLCISSVEGMKILFRTKKRALHVSVFASLLALSVLGFMLFETFAYMNPQTAGSVASYEIGSMLRGTSGNILVEDPSIAVAANKTLLFEPSALWVLEEHRLWNDTAILSSVQNRNFAAIAYEQPNSRFSHYPGLITAIHEYYRLNFSEDGLCVYIPDYANQTSSNQVGSSC